jgi:hypothetical protein
MRGADLPKVLFPGVWIRCFHLLCYTADRERLERQGRAICLQGVSRELRRCGRGREGAVACVIAPCKIVPAPHPDTAGRAGAAM